MDCSLHASLHRRNDDILDVHRVEFRSVYLRLRHSNRVQRWVNNSNIVLDGLKFRSLLRAIDLFGLEGSVVELRHAMPDEVYLGRI